MRISDWSSDVCSSDLRDDDKRLPQPRFEILVTEFADQLQFVALAVPQPDRRQRHTVEAVRLHHRIMRLVEEGEALADPRAAGEAIVADDVAGEARRAAEPRGHSDRKSTRLNSSH